MLAYRIYGVAGLSAISIIFIWLMIGASTGNWIDRINFNLYGEGLLEFIATLAVVPAIILVVLDELKFLAKH